MYHSAAILRVIVCELIGRVMKFASCLSPELASYFQLYLLLLHRSKKCVDKSAHVTSLEKMCLIMAPSGVVPFSFLKIGMGTLETTSMEHRILQAK